MLGVSWEIPVDVINLQRKIQTCESERMKRLFQWHDANRVSPRGFWL